MCLVLAHGFFTSGELALPFSEQTLKTVTPRVQGTIYITPPLTLLLQPSHDLHVGQILQLVAHGDGVV